MNYLVEQLYCFKCILEVITAFENVFSCTLPKIGAALDFAVSDQLAVQGIWVKEVHQLSLPPLAIISSTGGVSLATMQQPLAMASIRLQLKMKGTVNTRNPAALNYTFVIVVGESRQLVQSAWVHRPLVECLLANSTIAAFGPISHLIRSH